jgi:hypothetical protein
MLAAKVTNGGWFGHKIDFKKQRPKNVKGFLMAVPAI